eukprot:jgi/Mesen1/1117/ME000123S00290
MVNAVKGVLVECDIPMAQYIISLDNMRRPAEKFILVRLDDTHLLVQPDAAAMIQHKVREWMDALTYEKPV